MYRVHALFIHRSAVLVPHRIRTECRWWTIALRQRDRVHNARQHGTAIHSYVREDCRARDVELSFDHESWTDPMLAHRGKIHSDEPIPGGDRGIPVKKLRGADPGAHYECLSCRVSLSRPRNVRTPRHRRLAPHRILCRDTSGKKSYRSEAQPGAAP